MINKYYEWLIKFIKENCIILTFYLVFIVTMTYQLPYYIYTGGGVINTDDRVKIDGEYNTKGSFNLSYVTQLNATIPSMILSKFNKEWDVQRVDSYFIDENDTTSNIEKREKLYLEEATDSAVINAYKLAGVKLKKINIENNVLYLSSSADTDIEIGDQVVSINNYNINDINDIRDVVSKYNVGDILNVNVIRNGKEKECYAKIYMNNGLKLIGISVISTFDYETNNNIEFKFENNESGPSGGLMMALTIYNKLTKNDLTKGLNIAGTGTIESDGTVGEIGGIKYKLIGAEKAKMDVFIAPTGENYNEVIKIKKEKNLKIKIIEAKNLKQVIDELNKL